MTRCLVFLAVLAIVCLPAYSQITGSPHDLSTGSSGVAHPQVTQICVFCHTPHGNATIEVGAPLWNKSINSTGYTTYGTTIANTTADSPPSNSTLACMSCHDGVTALSVLKNTPGSGSPAINAFPNLANKVAGDVLIGTIGLGKDMRNDHPVSITYTAGKASLRLTTYTINWSNGAYTTIADALRSGKVECGSCHDPHTENGAGGLFLRRSNASSGLCLDCHNK